MRSRRALAALSLVTTMSGASPAWADGELAGWGAFLATQELTSTTVGPSLWLDLHARSDEVSSTAIVRPGVGLRIQPWLSLWAGYAWTPGMRHGEDTRFDEHRAWSQVILQHTFATGLSVQSRTRFEHRFAEGSDEVAHRFRQFVRVGWNAPDVPLGVSVWNEVFVGFRGAEWGAEERYDQHRLFVGAILRVAQWMRVEPGYLFVHLDRSPDRHVHAFAVNVFFTGRAPAPVDSE